MLELQEGFDNERRNRDLALLNRENRLKEEQLLHRGLQQRLWMAGAAVGVLLLGVVVVLVRRVRDSNANLVSSNELLKVQSERDALTQLANRRHFQAAMRQDEGRLNGTLFLIDILLSHLKQWSPAAEMLLDGTPTVLVSRGKPDLEALRRARVSLDDVLESARQQHGLRRLDEVDFAVLEVGGKVSIIPKDR